MIEPAAAIYDMVFLNHTNATTDWRRVRKHDNLPTVISRVILNDFLKPMNLIVIDNNFVGSEFGSSENRRSKTNEKRLLCDQASELCGFLLMNTKIHYKTRQ